MKKHLKWILTGSLRVASLMSLSCWDHAHMTSFVSTLPSQEPLLCRRYANPFHPHTHNTHTIHTHACIHQWERALCCTGHYLHVVVLLCHTQARQYAPYNTVTHIHTCQHTLGYAHAHTCTVHTHVRVQ